MTEIRNPPLSPRAARRETGRNLGEQDVSLFGWDVLDGGGAGGDESVMEIDSQAAGTDEVCVDSRRVGGTRCVVLDYSCYVVTESDADAGLFDFVDYIFGWSWIVCAASYESSGACGYRADSSVSGGGGIGFVVSSDLRKIGRKRVDFSF